MKYQSIEEAKNEICAEYSEDEKFANESGYTCGRDEALNLLADGQSIHTVVGEWVWFEVEK